MSKEEKSPFHRINPATGMPYEENSLDLSKSSTFHRNLRIAYRSLLLIHLP